MNAPLPTSVPSSATPIAPPAWRLALSTPDAMPARSAGAAPMIAFVAAGIVNAMPKPLAIRSVAQLRPSSAVFHCCKFHVPAFIQEA